MINIIPPKGGFRCIVVDPPWRYGSWGGCGKGALGYGGPGSSFADSRKMPYPTMSLEEIRSLNIKGLAAQDCEVYLWTTSHYLPNAFEILRAWGFKYCQTLVWAKTPRGTGQGGIYCPTTEFVLLGRRGKMPKGKKRVDSTWWNWKRQQRHSKKPEDFQNMVEAVTDGPRLELFARREREGWTVWGNEV